MLYMSIQARYDAETMNPGAMTKECSTYDNGIRSAHIPERLIILPMILSSITAITDMVIQ